MKQDDYEKLTTRNMTQHHIKHIDTNNMGNVTMTTANLSGLWNTQDKIRNRTKTIRDMRYN